MANNRNPEKPSLILMLAPIAMVLLGYQYLFLFKMNADLADLQKKENKLLEQTQNIRLEQANVKGQLLVAKRELEQAQQQTKLAETELTEAESEKARLRASVLGPAINARAVSNVGSVNRVQSSTNDAGVDPEGNPFTSLAGQLANMLASTTSNQQGNETIDTGIAGGGQCYQMNSVCSILDSHRLRRIENSDRTSAGSSGLVTTERTALAELLGTSLPPISRFQILVEGSFPNLIAALRELNGLPSVSILSVSLDPGEVDTRQRVWNLQIGIRE